MFPFHQCDLYPHQKNQMQSAPHGYPSFEAIPPQMRENPDRLYNQSWPCSSSYGYVYPSQFHGCCEHNHFPSYYGLRSPYAQPPPPYYHGIYPVPPGAYPIHYISPPHHTMELPRYEYDKDMRGYYRCCGCPNHPCDWKVGKNLKIEEEGPDLENKVDDSSVPVNFRNYPNPPIWYSPNDMGNKEWNRSSKLQYEKQEDGSNGSKIHYQHPILWFAPNYIMNKEDSKSNEPQCEKGGDDSSSAKINYPYPLLWLPPMNIINKEDSISNEPQDEKQGRSTNGSKTHEKSEPSEQQGNFLNGRFPVVMNNLRTSERQQQQQQGDNKSGFPCPVFWMPSNPDERESKDYKRTGVGQESAQREPSHFEVSPVIVPETEENNKREVNEENIGRKGPGLTEKNNIRRTIPVKQAETEEEKNELKTKSSGMPLNGSEAGTSSADGGKRKSPCLPKSSKLPPVCLRVDPLPRNKNANGSSRSPSPPGDKGKSHEMSRGNIMPATSVDAKEISQQEIPSRNVMPQRAKDKEQHRSKIKTIQVSEGTGSQIEIGDSRPGSFHEGVPESQTNVRPRDAVDDLDATDVKCKGVAGARADDRSIHEKSKAEEKPANKAQESKRLMSEAEAARIIQSAYRGYEVRRWEPLKKLKQLMEVRKQVAESNSSIQAFESSLDIQDVEKWRTVIGETIMNLLLKLDTVQGMHPSIRDVRKSVARELVGLQEKVDYLTKKKAETLAQQASTVLSTENIYNGNSLCIKEGQEEEKQDQENSQSETDPLNEFHQEVASQDESNPRIHAVINSGNSDIPEVVKDEGDSPWESITEAIATETELQKGDPRIDAFSNSQNPDIPVLVTNEGKKTREPVAEPSSADTELQKSVMFPLVGDQTINPALGETCSLLKNEVSEVKAFEECQKENLAKIPVCRIILCNTS